jgi:aminoglycoside 3-N-acetyltransferase
MSEAASAESRAEKRELELVLRSKDHVLISVRSLADDLKNLGVNEGTTLLVHSSLSSLGWVCGGAAAVVLALEQVLGVEGTLVMPTHSADLSDPAQWQHPGVPEKWWQQIRDEMPAYEPDLTPTRSMGAISECFRKQNGTLRSNHPMVSFAARGKNAGFVTGSHSLEFPLGERSPLARVYDLNGSVLLLGVSHANNTSIHLSEYRTNYLKKKQVRMGAPVFQGNARQWIWYEDINNDDSDFEKIGGDFARETGLLATREVGLAKAHLMPQRALVDYAVKWIEKNRI